MKIEFSTYGFNKRTIEAKSFNKACDAASDYIFNTCGVCGCEHMIGLHCPACDKTHTKQEFSKIVDIRFAGLNIKCL